MKPLRILRTLRNYLCYCGIEKEEYNALKKEAYISNFRVWRILHYLMALMFSLLIAASYFSGLMGGDRVYYLVGLLYSWLAIGLFFVLKRDSILAQFLIYATIVFLFVYSSFVSQNNPESPAVTFIVLLLITPMFMIDKPYFMIFVLSAASTVFLVWMHAVKPSGVWEVDVANVVPFTLLGIFLHIISNSIRIREFVLTRQLGIQRDTDELTGLKNKAALTREINAYLRSPSDRRGILLLLDIDRFKAINDTYGHDAGDGVIRRLGEFLRDICSPEMIVGRFGGDEFVVFVRDSDDPALARRLGEDIVSGAAETVPLPNPEEQLCVSVGVALYHGLETNYSEIFNKADTAMYMAKANPTCKVCFYQKAEPA